MAGLLREATAFLIGIGLPDGWELAHDRRYSPDTVFTFSWAAPGGGDPDVLGTYRLFTCVEQVNANGSTSGDGPTVCDTRDITVTNAAPDAIDDLVQVSENDALDFDVCATNDSDPDSEVPEFVSSTVAAAGAAGLTYTGDGTTCQFRFDAGSGFDALAAGDSQDFLFDYTVRDIYGLSDTATVTARVNGVNDTPAANPDSISVSRGGTTTTLVNGAASVLANDTDVDTGSVLNAQKLSDPANGTLALAGDGTFTYTHDGTATTTDQFSYLASDGTADSAVVTVSISVGPQDPNAPDTVPPVITVTDRVVTSEGCLTDVDPGAIAEDVIDGAITPTPDLQGPFAPERHMITWTATDAASNTATVQQRIDVLPLVTLGGAQVTGEGQTVSVPVTVSGSAPAYPVVVDYTVGGTATAADHDLAAGSVNIAAEGADARLEIAIAADALAENDETIVITLTGINANASLGENLVHTVLITERNIEPAVALTIEQATGAGSVSGPYIYLDQVPGTVTVTAQASDPNGDPLSYDWTGSDEALNGTPAGNRFGFETAGLEPGTYTVKVVVGDGMHQVTQATVLVVGETAPVLGATDSDGDGLSDVDEGRSDDDRDGLPNYLDAANDGSQLQTRIGDSAQACRGALRASAGLTLFLGDMAVQAQHNGARIDGNDVKDENGQPVADPDFNVVGSLYDFEIYGLSDAQRTARVVIPLQQPIPSNAVYRKFAQGAWSTFIQNGTDGVRSAPPRVRQRFKPGSWPRPTVSS